MRGADVHQDELFSYVFAGRRMPRNPPLRPVRLMVDDALEEMSAHSERAGSAAGRPSVAPEKSIRALLPQIFHAVRSERLLREQLVSPPGSRSISTRLLLCADRLADCLTVER